MIYMGFRGNIMHFSLILNDSDQLCQLSTSNLSEKLQTDKICQGRKLFYLHL